MPKVRLPKRDKWQERQAGPLAEACRQYLPIVACLPYFINGAGRYMHRIKSATIHIHSGKYSHTSVHYHCNNCSRLCPHQPFNEMLDWHPPGVALCSRCFPSGMID